MSSIPDDPTPAAPPRSAFSWIATSNPFYVISAGLFLFGLRVSFGETDSDINITALAAGLGIYTLLLAAAAVVLVRFAGIWNDVRTLLLLVVFLFLATSVTFDELLAVKPALGRVANLGGLAFAILLSEGILRAIRLRLPLGFKLPYYLLLGLFFVYPILVAPMYPTPHSERLQWSLFAFPSAAGLAFLTLIPAIRRGPVGVRGNGSPWPWPFYPWSLFVFLAVAAIGRSYLLCRSFQQPFAEDETATIFAPFFLVPLGFALAVLLLELGLVARSKATMLAGLATPVLLVMLAGVGHREEETYRGFLDLFLARTHATPLFLTVLMAIGFSLYAWCRGVPFATEALTAALAGLAFIESDTLTLRDVTLLRPDQLIFPVALQGFLGLVKRAAWRLIAVSGVAAAWLTGAIWRLYLVLRAEVAGLDYLLLSLLLLPIGVLVSLAKAGVLGRWLERQRSRLRMGDESH